MARIIVTLIGPARLLPTISMKRRREELDDSDDDEPAYGRQILPVANLPQDFDEDPIDGMQYLFTVRRDARQLPDVVRVSNPHDEPKPPSTAAVTINTIIQSSLPSEEWRELFEFRFRNFQKNLNQPTIHVGPANYVKGRLMPDKKERDMWWDFLAGKPESDWNPPKRPKKQNTNSKKSQPYNPGLPGWSDNSSQGPRQEFWQTNDEGEVEEVLTVDPAESLPSPVGTPLPSDSLDGVGQLPSSSCFIPTKLAFDPREPTTRILKLIDEPMALHLLMYFTYWINLHLQASDSSRFPTESHARWIFSLLFRIDVYISADEMHLLRNLARACLGLLKEFKEEQPSLQSDAALRLGNPGKMQESSCWIIITTVATVWKQRDLWIEAEDLLRRNSIAP